MFKLFTFIIFLSFIFSCDDTVEPTEENGKKLLPLEVGNYWIYDSYEKDFSNNNIGSSRTEDSLVIESSENNLNELAYRFVRYRNGKSFDTMFFAYRNEIIYRLYDSNSTTIPNLKLKWFPIVDLTKKVNAPYNVYKQTIGNYTFYEDNIQYKGEFWHTINGELIVVDSIEYEGKKYLRKIFTNKFDSKLEYKKPRKLSETKYDTLLVKRLMKYYDTYQLLEGIGFYKIKRDSYTINTITEPSSTFEKAESVKGFESSLKRYKLK